MAHDEDDLPDDPANEAGFGMAANHEEKDTRPRIDDVLKSPRLFEHDLYMGHAGHESDDCGFHHRGHGE